ncbi:MAG: SPOR domain-containing protein [Magnetococcus sp. WYHC-3]
MNALVEDATLQVPWPAVTGLPVAPQPSRLEGGAVPPRTQEGTMNAHNPAAPPAADATRRPRAFFPIQGHGKAWRVLRKALEQPGGAILLLGAPGTGKTLFLARLKQLLEGTVDMVLLGRPQCDYARFMGTIIKGLDPAAPLLAENRRPTLDDLKAAYRVRVEGGRPLVIAVDSAEQLGGPNLELIGRLAALSSENALSIHVILAGRPELARLVRSDAYRPVLESLRGHGRLGALKPWELGPFVRDFLRHHHLEGVQTSLGGLWTLYRHTDGMPGQVDRVLNHFMMSGVASKQPVLSRRVLLELVANPLPRSGVGILEPQATPDGSKTLYHQRLVRGVRAIHPLRALGVVGGLLVFMGVGWLIFGSGADIVVEQQEARLEPRALMPGNAEPDLLGQVMKGEAETVPGAWSAGAGGEDPLAALAQEPVAAEAEAMSPGVGSHAVPLAASAGVAKKAAAPAAVAKAAAPAAVAKAVARTETARPTAAAAGSHQDEEPVRRLRMAEPAEGLALEPATLRDPPVATPKPVGMPYHMATRMLPSEVTRPAAPPATQGAVVQAGSFLREALAKQLVGKLTAKGVPAFVHPRQVAGRTWYSVRIGYKDPVSAEKGAAQMREQEKLPAVVLRDGQ